MHLNMGVWRVISVFDGVIFPGYGAGVCTSSYLAMGLGG